MDSIISRLQAAKDRIREAKTRIESAIDSTTGSNDATGLGGDGASTGVYLESPQLKPISLPLDSNGLPGHGTSAEGLDIKGLESPTPHDVVWDGTSGADNSPTQDTLDLEEPLHDEPIDLNSIDWGNPQQDGLDVYNEDLTQPDLLQNTVTSEGSVPQPPSEPMGNTQIETTTTDDTTSFTLFDDSLTISTGTISETEVITSQESNSDTTISSTTTNQSGIEVTGSSIDGDAPFDTGVTISGNAGTISQNGTTNSGPADALTSISEDGKPGSIANNAGNMMPGVTITETEGTGLAGSLGVGAGAQSTVNTNDGIDLEDNPVPGVDITATINADASLSGEVVNSEIDSVSRPGDEAGTEFHTETVETGTQTTTTIGLEVSASAGISSEFDSGTPDNPQTSTMGVSGNIQGGIEVQQTTTNTLGSNYNLTADNDQSQQQQQHLDTGIPSVEADQPFTQTETVSTTQTLQGGAGIQLSESTHDDDFLTHDDQGSNVDTTTNQAIQSTSTQSTTDHMTSATGNQQDDGSAPTALPSDSEVAFTNTTTSTSVNSGLGSGSITMSDDGTSDGPMITVESTGPDGVTQSTGGLSPDEFVDLADQASGSNPSNGLLSNADPANIGDSGVGDMGNVLSNHDTQQGIDSMIDQQTVNAQNTASDNQLIGLADSTSGTTETGTTETGTSGTTGTSTTNTNNGSSDHEQLQQQETSQQQQQEIDAQNTASDNQLISQAQEHEANNDSDESASSSSSSCFLTTSACEHRGLADDCHELTVLRGFRDTWMHATPDLQEQVREYYRVAPAVVDAIQRMPDRTATLERMFTEYICPSVEAIERGENAEAYDIYVKMLHNVQELTATYMTPPAI